MAENTNELTVESPGAYYAQDFSLKTLNILDSSGQRFEFRRLVVEFSYYEDIYSFAMSGYVTIKDAQGFIEKLRLSGTEYLEVEFGKVKDAPNTDKSIYRIYKVGNRTPMNNMNGEYYTLYFCSEELLLSEQYKISKSYSGKKISEIVSDVLTNKLQVQDKKINVIEETTGVYDFVIPRMKPFEAISWISTYARPKDTPTVGADMLFFENRYGFNYRSIQSMLKEDVYATYKYQQGNIDQPFQEETITVLNYEFIKTYDSLSDINSGTYANRLISLDPISRTFKVTDFDYNDYLSQSTRANKEGVLVQSENRFGITQNEAYDSKLKLVMSNAFQGNEEYIKQIPGSTAKDIGIENYVPLRTAQLALANYTVVKIVIPGDPGISAGRTINFNLMTVTPTTGERELDSYYSGKYLVSAVRHIVQSDGVYQTVLEITKESVPNSLGSVYETVEWNEAIEE